MEENESDAAETLAKQGGITLVGGIVSKLLGFLFIGAVTRLVSPSEYGLYTLALSVVVIIANIAHLNLHRSLDYFLPQLLNQDKYGEARGLLVQVTGYSFGLSVVAAALLWTLSNRISLLFHKSELTVILSIFAIALPLLTLNDVLTSLYSGIKKMRYRLLTQNITLPMVKISSVLFFLPAGFGVIGILYSYILSLFISILIGVFLVFKSETWLFSSTFKKTSVRRLVSYSAPLAMAGVIYSIVGYVDYFVIGYYRQSSDVGVYRVSYFLSANLMIFLSSFAPIFKPMIAETKDDSAALQSTYQLATRWATILTIPAAITMAIAPITYLTFLFDASYATTPYVVIILVLGFLINAGVGPEGMMLEGLGYTRLTLLNTIVMITLNFIVNVLLVPEIGIVGAAIGTTVAMTTAVGMAVLEINYITDVMPFDAYTPRILVAAFPSTLVGFLVVSLLDGLILVLVLPPVVLLSYLLILRNIQGFAPEDRNIAEEIDRKVGVRLFQLIVPEPSAREE